ncbi:3-methyl-2-oxobutanoate hydroxymethyltransferase [Armatimonas rosea]|uniref:3-methyl-2-oxobutanoate hydroxymethyltransferase n=1 Tax=Armatimonas rosea TaxID=685828 RepID=A0A7W9W7X7_ARMRO|nr:3-methyl-2-oxobutanoate hydroxymethyltransferase [Armatimonas rosea]MBB6051691.1 3-methyl-2-oxobutanoate hydroxymethyltransferase [Armatimonas rosea]
MTLPDFRRRKALHEPITVVTCYDYAFAHLVARTELDCILVGDSVAMVVHGHPSTLAADLPMMQLHTESVARGAGTKFIVADMPFLEHRKGQREAVSAAQLLLRAGAHAVKIEGAAGNLTCIQNLVEGGVPVMGHVGLTPQFIHAFGGFKVQGREDDAAERILADAKALETAGVFALVIEGVPAPLGKRITEALTIPTIGIGAGPATDGQVLVLHDLLGFTEKPPKLARAFGQVGAEALAALRAYDSAVKSAAFPTEKESYR